jgi:hypothetical protein
LDAYNPLTRGRTGAALIPASFMRFTDYLFSLQGLLFNIAFATLALGLQIWGLPAVHDLSDEALAADINTGIGIALLSLMVVEALALRIKLRSYSYQRRSLRMDAGGTQRTSLLVLWVLHIALSVLVGLIALDALGVVLSEPNWANVAVITIIISKELYVLIMMLLPADEHEPMSAAGLFFADLTILLFSGATYAGVWRFLVDRPDVKIIDYTVNETLIQGAVAALVFLVFFIPVRIGFVPEERLIYRTFASRLALWVSIAAAVAAGIAPLFYE